MGSGGTGSADFTFLQYICEHLMGEPIREGGAAGESYWYCPRCGGEKFHTMPAKPQFKDRWMCWSCAWRGDEHDLLKHFGADDYQARLNTLAKWRPHYESTRNSLAASLATHSRAGAATYPPGDFGGYRRDDPEAIAKVIKELRPQDKETLLAALEILWYLRGSGMASFEGVSYEGLMTRLWLADEARYEDMMRWHAAGCTDPYCGDECRQLRGLPPLDPAERAADNRRREEEREEERRRFDEAVASVRRAHGRHETNGFRHHG
jgi:hypothetical protein